VCHDCEGSGRVDYLVKLKIENRARRVPALMHVLRAGESITIDYFFSLPPDLEDLRLRIAPGGWSGVLLEWLLFGRKEFQLP
jgi:hypothetical protein